jgi:hypothetical protein
VLNVHKEQTIQSILLINLLSFLHSLIAFFPFKQSFLGNEHLNLPFLKSNQFCEFDVKLVQFELLLMLISIIDVSANTICPTNISPITHMCPMDVIVTIAKPQ